MNSMLDEQWEYCIYISVRSKLNYLRQRGFCFCLVLLVCRFVDWITLTVTDEFLSRFFARRWAKKCSIRFRRDVEEHVSTHCGLPSFACLRLFYAATYLQIAVASWESLRYMCCPKLSSLTKVQMTRRFFFKLISITVFWPHESFVFPACSRLFKRQLLSDVTRKICYWNWERLSESKEQVLSTAVYQLYILDSANVDYYNYYYVTPVVRML